ncbi:MAG: hypothetical protein R2876_01195 [Eubacteriales bacterium]
MKDWVGIDGLRVSKLAYIDNTMISCIMTLVTIFFGGFNTPYVCFDSDSLITRTE